MCTDPGRMGLIARPVRISNYYYPQAAWAAETLTHEGLANLVSVQRGVMRSQMHGGKSTGAPKGNNNAHKHGNYSAREMARRIAMKYLLKWD